MAARVIDVALAALLVGLLAEALGMATVGVFAWHLLALVPLSLMWGFLLGTAAMHSLAALLFPVMTIVVLLLVWLAVRFLELRPLRVVAVAVLFAAQVLGLVSLMYVMGISA